MSWQCDGKGGRWVDAESRRIAALGQISAEQVLRLGIRHVVYLKGDMCDGGGLFILYGADGSPIAIVESALELVAAWGLDLASIQ